MSYTGGKNRLVSVKLLGSLPNEVLEELKALDSTKRDFNVEKFLEEHLPRGASVEVFAELKKIFTLDRWKIKKKKTVVRKKKTQLNLKEKRKLGLYTLNRKDLKYNDFLDLHSLWVQYMLNSIDVKKLGNTRNKVDTTDKFWIPVSIQLEKADYHGAYVRVLRSCCPSVVGIEGIIVMDTRNTFKILGKDNIARTIPKESSLFQVKFDKYELTLYGKYLCTRPSERSTKKIKNLLIPDL